MEEGIKCFGPILVEFNYEGQNRENNGGTMMYNYGLDYRELCGQFLVLATAINIKHNLYKTIVCG